MNDIEIDQFTARYIAVWNEPDAATREAAVAGLWSADARACTGANEYVGVDAITPTDAHHDGVRIRWEMVPASGGDAVSGGTQFLLLDRAGRVRSDHQFIDF